MFKTAIFAGTTEGRELAELLRGAPAEVFAFTATGYGGSLIEPAENISVFSGRLDEERMEELFKKEGFDIVLDATHPYAEKATENIASACEKTGTRYLRVLRESSRLPEDCLFAADAREAARVLAESEGSVLLTTGSKELGAFSGLKDFKERVWARVLPSEASLAACAEAGLPPAHVIAMQGPFSEEMNEALLRMCGASVLVTKDGGRAGGFEEKIAAARKTGARVLVIGRPPQKEGVSVSEAALTLEKELGVTLRPLVTVCGIGSGSPEGMTLEVLRAVREADCLIGARRMIDTAAAEGKPAFEAVAPRDIVSVIENARQFRRFAVLMSGDSGFYSGAKKLLPLLENCEVKILPGVSSLSLLCARLGLSYEDIPAVSLHGRDFPVEGLIAARPRVFVMTGGADGVNRLCARLAEAGLKDLKLFVGERLGYADERVSSGSPEELKNGVFDSLSAVIVENPAPKAPIFAGLPDDSFERELADGSPIPMTKSEVRAVCLSKLRVEPHHVCWDIGSGTGSVTAEMALQAYKGRVYAAEKKPEAAELTLKNTKKLGCFNVSLARGAAPAVCGDFPAPDRVFIGGSSGDIKSIIASALEKNPFARVVATAVTLETVAELTAAMKDFGFDETEVVSLTVAKGRKAGPYELMTGQNPVYIFTMQRSGKE